MLQQQLAQEQQQLAAASAAAAHNQQIQNEVDKYRALIIQAISQNWLVPDSVNPDDTCIILVKVGPGALLLMRKWSVVAVTPP
ncbi:MAG: cell envelope integrity protein TolA [Coxiellaceae bacterium]|nr:MAG: cell envelope integrity protein TolA [Coxiellaceae bacterium]